MPNTHEILTELVDYSVGNKVKELHPKCDILPKKLRKLTRTAIATATEQINQQERERTEILRIALNTIWTKPITEQLAYEIADNALAEWEAKGH